MVYTYSTMYTIEHHIGGQIKNIVILTEIYEMVEQVNLFFSSGDLPDS